MAKWGDIGDWDVSNVADFSRALSTSRNEAGEGIKTNGNLKAASFVGASLSKWITISATSMHNTFYGASEMNTDVSGWDVAKVTNLHGTFRKASNFQGTGIDKWITSSLVTMQETFMQAVTMDADLSKWNVATVTTLKSTFYNAVKFTASGLDSWDTASVTNLQNTFYKATEMNADLNGWKVGKVVTLQSTFDGASKFTGMGLSFWDTASAISLYRTFYNAKEMNTDLNGWKVGKVITLYQTFYGASKFTGMGLPTWNIARVTNQSMAMVGTFTSAMSITSCNKRRIADTWKSNSAFAAWDTAWADACPPLTDATFKQASWGTRIKRKSMCLWIPCAYPRHRIHAHPRWCAYRMYTFYIVCADSFIRHTPSSSSCRLPCHILLPSPQRGCKTRVQRRSRGATSATGM